MLMRKTVYEIKNFEFHEILLYYIWKVQEYNIYRNISMPVSSSLLYACYYNVIMLFKILTTRQMLHLLKIEMCFLCKSVDKGYFLEIDPSWLHRNRSMSIQSSCNSRKFTFHCHFAVSLVRRVENSAGKLQEIYIKFSQ